MKPILFPIIIVIAIILFSINCFAAPTNERTACRYKLENNFGSVDNISCAFAAGQFIVYSDSSSTPQQKEEALIESMFFLSQCVEYHKRLEECNKEINKYIPTLHPQ